jgi:diguanylate cyclase (GGDEF)-like protein
VLRDGDRIGVGNVYLRLDILDPNERLVELRLRESSIRDPLTGLYNRGVFDERLAAEVAFSRRHGSALALIMLDVDHFKKVNDTYGHSGGDAVLRVVAERIQETVRTEDVTARYGGEELSVIARGVDREGVMQLAERIRAAVESARVSTGGTLIKVTLSAGAAVVSGQRARTITPVALLQAADTALYMAKNAGRNRVICAA